MNQLDFHVGKTAPLFFNYRQIRLTNYHPNDSLINRSHYIIMDIRIKLNYYFQPYAGNREIVEVRGNTVRECLDSLTDLYPIFKELLFSNDDTLSALVLYDGETIVPKDLDRPVAEEGELVLLPMIQGG